MKNHKSAITQKPLGQDKKMCKDPESVELNHRHIRKIDCLKAHTASLVCLNSTVSGHS